MKKRQCEDCPYRQEKRHREAAERVTRIHNEIKAGHYPNCSSLARKLGVSVKSIRGDVDFLRTRYHMPIEYDSAKKGFYYSQKATLPGHVELTDDEKLLFVATEKLIAGFAGKQVGSKVRQAFKSMLLQLGGDHAAQVDPVQNVVSFSPFAPEPIDPETYSTLARAVRSRSVVRFAYQKPGCRNAERRVVHPYHINFNDGRWYLVGFDMGRKEIRTFVVSRMSLITVTEETFADPGFDFEKYMEGTFGVMRGNGSYDVVIKLDGWAGDMIGKRSLRPEVTATRQEDGSVILKLHVNSLAEVVNWVLRWGPHAEALGPSELRERVAGSLRRALKFYEGVEEKAEKLTS